MKRDRHHHDYKSEAELCSFFAEYARAVGWKVFPETSDHDLLLVAGADVRTMGVDVGEQIGVQAKLLPNVEVLYQAMPHPHAKAGPNYHAILVPRATQAFKVVAGRLGIIVFEATGGPKDEKTLERSVRNELMALPSHLKTYYPALSWHPEIELWTQPGVPHQTSITPWKVGAVRLCMVGVERGFLT